MERGAGKAVSPAPAAMTISAGKATTNGVFPQMLPPAKRKSPPASSPRFSLGDEVESGVLLLAPRLRATAGFRMSKNSLA